MENILEYKESEKISMLPRNISKKYMVPAGIGTDHECFTYEEAVEKIKLGIKNNE